MWSTEGFGMSFPWLLFVVICCCSLFVVVVVVVVNGVDMLLVFNGVFED
jgi:hypothetical protein